MLIEAIRAASGADRKELLHWLSLKEFNKDEKVKAVSKLYAELDIPRKVIERIDQYHSLAVSSLEGLGTEPEKKSVLLSFSDYMLHRKK